MKGESKNQKLHKNLLNCHSNKKRLNYMKKVLYIIILFIVYSSLNSQSIERFKSEFSKIDTNTFDDERLDYFFSEYSSLIVPFSGVTTLESNHESETVSKYPLSVLSEDPQFKNENENFLNSENVNLRTLSYLIIAGTGDKTKEKILLERLNTEAEMSSIWLCMALMHLESNSTTLIFDYLVKNEDFADAHMLQFFVNLNKDSLRNTAYLRINDDNLKAKVLASQILSRTGSNEKTEKLLKEAVEKWDFNIKGYAINSIKELQIGNLKDLLIPLLDSLQTRGISLQALANSPTDSDRDIFVDLINTKDTISDDFLHSLVESENKESNKLFLKLIQKEKIPVDYHFSIVRKEVFYSDEFLPLVQEAVENISNPESLGDMIRALGSREDEKSLGLVFKAMRHDNSTVRYWATASLRGNKSGLITEQVQSIMDVSSLRTISTVDLAIERNLNSYQGIMEKLYNQSSSLDWKRKSIEYLSTFPLERNTQLFKSALADTKSDFFIKRMAVIGLGKLKDTSSVDMIIENCNRDSNTSLYLKALGLIKGEKAKAHLLEHKDSDDTEVREMVNTILKEWDE